MESHDQFVKIRNNVTRERKTISNAYKSCADSQGNKSLNIIWLYPDILNLHGGRGDMMALLHISNLMRLPAEIMRIDSPDEKIPFEWADMIFLSSGDIKSMDVVVEALNGQREELEVFLNRSGMMIAIGSSGLVLAKEMEMLDGSRREGLGILDMLWKEKTRVAGDDIWFSLDDGLEVIGNQIQLADVFLGENQQPLGRVLYGRGNKGDGWEGARKGNVIFTSCLGPVLVKNPGLTERWLEEAAFSAGIKAGNKLDIKDIQVELEALSLVKEFIKAKLDGNI